MLENLTDNQVAVLTELTIHHGMYRYEKDSYKYKIYYEIAGEMMDELTERGKPKKWIKHLVCEFMEAQFKTVPEVEGK